MRHSLLRLNYAHFDAETARSISPRSAIASTRWLRQEYKSLCAADEAVVLRNAVTNTYEDSGGPMKYLRRAVVVSIVSISIGSASPSRAGGEADGQRWWAHVAALADDRLEGRGTGSPGHRKAAEYVAREFERIGLEPAGTEGFLQSVRLIVSELDEAHSNLTLVHDSGGETPLVLGRDAVLRPRVEPAPSVEAKLVFAGYGLSNPEAHHNDFSGLDVRGKIVVCLAGAPASIPGPLAAHMQSGDERALLLKRLGAIGLVTIMNPKNMDIPWERAALARFLPAMSLADPALDESRSLKLAVTINPAHADKLLAGSGHTVSKILEAATAGKPLPHFAIPAMLKASAATTHTEIDSQNVVARLPGSDPKLKGEYVVFTAHLDHLGIGKPINGDSIYNGAMDNASGIAAMIDVAAMLKESDRKLRRSVLFVAVTGEEKGLLGSKFFTNHPTVDPRAIVANINTDMFLPLFPLKKLLIYGMDESDLGADAAAVAETMRVEPQRDQDPKRNIFIRSDQYSFIRRGVPALALKIGFDKGSPQEQVQKKWLTERYHAPSDDIAQPVDKQAAGLFEVLVAKLIERIANRDQRPRWKDSSFFKRFAPKPS
jgi:Peptidase family M28